MAPLMFDISALTLLEVKVIVGRQSRSSFDREFLHQMHRITRFGLLAIINSLMAPLVPLFHNMLEIQRPLHSLLGRVAPKHDSNQFLGGVG